jgi:hypothetical protein
MKEYLLVAKGSRKTWDETSEQDWQSVMDGFSTWIAGMKEKDLWIRGDRLTEKREVISLKDGPFAETKEAMTGFFLFKAENMAQAKELAKGCPSLLHDHLILTEMEGERP